MNTQASLVKVSQLRTQIYRCFDLINIHWSACASESEQVAWFGTAFNAFNKLNNMECKRTKDHDIKDRERVNDLYCEHISNHFDLWQKARIRFLDDFDPAFAIKEVQKLNEDIELADNEIKLYSSALFHFEEKADLTKVKQWKARLESSKNRRIELVELMDSIISKTQDLLKRRQADLESNK